MAYSNSSLVVYKRLSPNHSGQRTHPISKITIHHMAGNLSIEACGNIFASPARECSSNYGIGTDGRIGMYVEEKNASWCSSSEWNDQRAITIEVANSKTGGDWPVSDKAMASLIKLCVDICKRNNIKQLKYTGDPSGSLTLHYFYSATACPGPYLKSKIGYIVKEVNSKLSAKPTSTTKKTKKSVATLAKEVIAGKWGNGETRKKKLTAAGYNYAAVQAEVDKLMGKNTKKSVAAIAKEVIAGKWGNGQDRKKRLEAAGYNYAAVQAEVNKLL